MKQSPFRILSIALSSRGFGYAVTEGKQLIDYGKKVISEDKNNRVLSHIQKLIHRNKPDGFVLQEVNAKGTYRAARIKNLHQKVIQLAKKRKIKAVKISGKELRSALLGDENGTKHEMAEVLAGKFPEELASRLPPKRKTWKSQDARMDIFEAVALAVAFGKS